MRERDLARRRDRAERVRDLRGSTQTCLRPNNFVLVEDDLASIVDGRHAQPCALLGRQHLPGHDVGVVLEPRDHDLVALVHVPPAPRLRDQVDAFGRAAHEHDLVRRRRVDEAADTLPSGLVGIGRARRERVRTTVDVGVLVLVEVFQPIDDGLRLLRGRRIVEPDGRLPLTCSCKMGTRGEACGRAVPRCVPSEPGGGWSS
jgi:hypothetical protein